MKILVAYKSKTGYTKQYAKWIAEELSAELKEVKKMNPKIVADYDVVIYGGGMYAGKINGITSVIKVMNEMPSKKFIIFGVGAAPYKENIVEEIKEKNLSEAKKKPTLFYMQGGFEPDKLGFFMKLMLKGVSNSIQKKANKDPEALSDDDKMFLQFFQGKGDYMNRNNIKELIEVVG